MHVNLRMNVHAASGKKYAQLTDEETECVYIFCCLVPADEACHDRLDDNDLPTLTAPSSISTKGNH